jgi:hypothetical protein
MADTLLNQISQPICLITKANKTISYGNPAMLKLHNIVGSNFNEFFIPVEKLTYDIFNRDHFDDKPILLTIINSKSSYYGYFSYLDPSTLILLLTPCFLKQEIIENEFLRNHEYVVDFIEYAPICIHACTSTGEYIWANSQEHNVLGCSIGELYGKNISEVSLI